MHLGRGNPSYQYRQWEEGVESSPAKKDLGVLMYKKLDMSHQYAFSAQNTKCIMGCITSSVASRSSEGILPLCSMLVRPHWESCIRIWSPQHKKDMEVLERVQRRPQK